MSGSRNNLAMTPGAARTVARCRRQAGVLARTDSWAAFLVMALLQEESLASACLQRLGITRDWLSSGLLGAEVAQLAAQPENEDDDELDVESLDPDTMPLEASVCSKAGAAAQILEALNDPLEFTRVLDRATELARRGPNESGVSSANLLVAIVETNGDIRQQFETVGATLARIREELYPEQMTRQVPITVEFNLLFSEGTGERNLITPKSSASPVISTGDERPRVPAQRPATGGLRLPNRDESAPLNQSAPLSVWRILDANLNRAREGLRVLEDFARFLADNHDVSLKLKSMRPGGAILLTAGTPGKRNALPNARIMIHQPLAGMEGTATDLEIHAKEVLRIKGKMNDILLKHTGQTLTKIEDDTDRDNFMSADEAKQYNLIDNVLQKLG